MHNDNHRCQINDDYAIQCCLEPPSYLPSRVLSFFEDQLKADLSGVRLYNCVGAHLLNYRRSTLALATKNEIFFSRGCFRLERPNGLRLLAHELAHVAQKRNAVRLTRGITCLVCRSRARSPPRRG